MSFSNSTRKKSNIFLRSTRNSILGFFQDKIICCHWYFIKVPWQGGFWEHMVGSMKHCLQKVMGQASLPLKKMPITRLSYPLTPSSLIYGRTIATMPND
jgi:hypothetical protein